MASLLLVLTAATAAARTPEDENGYIYYNYTDEYAPYIEADSSVFYRAVQATEDIFAEVYGGRISFLPYTRRGERIYGGVFFDGIPVRAENRTVLNGLKTECVRYSGLRCSENLVGGMLGFASYESSRAEPLPVHSVGVYFSDRGYNAGVRAAVSETLGRGWSLSAFLSGRTGRDLHVRGVFSNAASVGLSAVKRWDAGSMLSITAMFSPSENGMRRASVDEAFTLTGDKRYNPSWGYQSGKIRNANVRRMAVPSVVAAYDTAVSDNTSVNIAVGVDAGTKRYSALEWFDALTPMPDNYRFLPGWYEDASVAADVAAVWRKGDARYTQIDWDELYERNRLAGGEAVYAVGDRVERLADVSFRAGAVTCIGNDIVLGYGARISYSNHRNYRRMRDLLGGEYIVDIDSYLVDDQTFRNKLQNDLRHPDRVIREGDKYGYDYAAVDGYGGIYVTLKRHRDRSRLDFAAEIGGDMVFRRGYCEKELFPGNGSYGRSRMLRMSPYTVKAAYGYSFTPRHYLEICGAVAGVTPDAEDLFLQMQYNNRIIDDPRLRTDCAAEVNYTFLHRAVNLRATVFALASLGGCEVSHCYDDLAGEYCDMTVSDINRLNIGVELAATIRIARHWDASVLFTAGRYAYVSDPRVSLYADTDNRLVCDRAVAHMGSCTAGSAPQLAAVAEVSYRNRGWGLRLGANYAGFRYAEPQAMRRTDRVSRAPSVSEEMFRRFVGQERLPDAVTLNAAVWKSFRVSARSLSRMTVSFSADNILNSGNIVYSARESMRVHRTYLAGGYLYAPFATTKLYAYPLTLRLAVSYGF